MAENSVTTAAEHALISATLGYTTVEIVKLWRDAAPSLEEVRKAGIDSPQMHQRMMDANYLGAGLSLMLGGTVSFMSHSWIPLLLSLGVMSFMAFWYRMVLHSDNNMMADNET